MHGTPSHHLSQTRQPSSPAPRNSRLLEAPGRGLRERGMPHPVPVYEALDLVLRIAGC
ncbi:hypothetical protein BDV95DRAFT_583730 [Massariosphaeria phaeospora]|uniref:Uncharacterized protein n=1 Tax=Massariosphaeria phaeospora TaxID=100035 RepID=A0A7C8HZX3_9PLEO|nr:hypothetical protein BDV95DRAFT_583730 [Massariosphaeria phaeospora]